jgi:hypothetical protein
VYHFVLSGLQCVACMDKGVWEYLVKRIELGPYSNPLLITVWPMDTPALIYFDTWIYSVSFCYIRFTVCSWKKEYGNIWLRELS